MSGGREGTACLHRRSTAAGTCTGPSFRMDRRTVGAHVWDPDSRAALTRASDRYNRTLFAACTPHYSHPRALMSRPSRRGSGAANTSDSFRQPPPAEVRERMFAMFPHLRDDWNQMKQKKAAKPLAHTARPTKNNGSQMSSIPLQVASELRPTKGAPRR